MVNKEDLKIGMRVLVKGKYDNSPYIVEILDLGPTHFAHKHLFIISCHSYDDIIKILYKNVDNIK